MGTPNCLSQAPGEPLAGFSPLKTASPRKHGVNGATFSSLAPPHSSSPSSPFSVLPVSGPLVLALCVLRYWCLSFPPVHLPVCPSGLLRLPGLCPFSLVLAARSLGSSQPGTEGGVAYVGAEGLGGASTSPLAWCRCRAAAAGLACVREPGAGRWRLALPGPPAAECGSPFQLLGVVRATGTDLTLLCWPHPSLVSGCSSLGRARAGPPHGPRDLGTHLPWRWKWGRGVSECHPYPGGSGPGRGSGQTRRVLVRSPSFSRGPSSHHPTDGGLRGVGWDCSRTKHQYCHHGNHGAFPVMPTCPGTGPHMSQAVPHPSPWHMEADTAISPSYRWGN